MDKIKTVAIFGGLGPLFGTLLVYALFLFLDLRAGPLTEGAAPLVVGLSAGFGLALIFGYIVGVGPAIITGAAMAYLSSRPPTRLSPVLTASVVGGLVSGAYYAASRWFQLDRQNLVDDLVVAAAGAFAGAVVGWLVWRRRANQAPA